MKLFVSRARLLSMAVLLGLAAATALQAQERPIVMIDPGHGGPDAGVVEGELVEKDLILQIAFVVASEFVHAGYDVRLTRTGDYAVSWNDRRARAEEEGAALLIMLHINRNADPTRHGAEIYFSEGSPASVRAAAAFAEELRADGTEVLLDPRGQAFLQSPSVPTVMLEVGFMTNPLERRMLQSDAYHHELGRAFVRAAARLTR
jgi:N-acetylmuramoyl-L-alanine amidase